MTQNSPPTPPEHINSDCPATDDEWFSLIEPEISSDPVDPDRDEVLRLARKHARQVVAQTGMDIDFKSINWKVSRRLKQKHGYHRGSGPLWKRPSLVKLSLESLSANGWQQLMNTVRHELVHVWQCQHNQYNPDADSAYERGHGDSFEQWMPVLSITKTSCAVQTTWQLTCPACERTVATEQTRNRIAEEAARLSSQSCETCGVEYRVCRNGEDFPLESLPDKPTVTDAQDHVFLSHQPADDIPVESDWNPETVRLTRLPGIGKRTASKIGDTLLTIEDLLTEDTTQLAASVRDAVQAQYHDELYTRVLELHEKAHMSRSGNDLDLLDRARTEADSHWWERIEFFDETGEIEQLHKTLYDRITPGDLIQITVVDHGTYRAKVTETERAMRPPVVIIAFTDSDHELASHSEIIAESSTHEQLPRLTPGGLVWRVDRCPAVRSVVVLSGNK